MPRPETCVTREAVEKPGSKMHSTSCASVGRSVAEKRPEAIKAFARLEINRMERGIPYLDVIYVAAPLLGLTGTVSGLLRVFGQISPETGLPDPVAFTKGVSLALSATLIGLGVALLALVPAGYLQRKIENYAAKIDLLLERILATQAKS